MKHYCNERSNIKDTLCSPPWGRVDPGRAPGGRLYSSRPRISSPPRHPVRCAQCSTTSAHSPSAESSETTGNSRKNTIGYNLYTINVHEYILLNDGYKNSSKCRYHITTSTDLMSIWDFFRIAGLEIGLVGPVARGASRFENLLAPQKTYWPGGPVDLKTYLPPKKLTGPYLKTKLARRKTICINLQFAHRPIIKLFRSHPRKKFQILMVILKIKIKN